MPNGDTADTTTSVVSVELRRDFCSTAPGSQLRRVFVRVWRPFLTRNAPGRRYLRWRSRNRPSPVPGVQSLAPFETVLVRGQRRSRRFTRARPIFTLSFLQTRAMKFNSWTGEIIIRYTYIVRTGLDIFFFFIMNSNRS